MSMRLRHLSYYFFFFNDTATTEIYTLSLHDALPISSLRRESQCRHASSVSRSQALTVRHKRRNRSGALGDRKSTRLNSSHGYISHAVFCLKKNRFFSVHIREYTLRDATFS